VVLTINYPYRVDILMDSMFLSFCISCKASGPKVMTYILHIRHNVAISIVSSTIQYRLIAAALGAIRRLNISLAGKGALNLWLATWQKKSSLSSKISQALEPAAPTEPIRVHVALERNLTRL
jgi:hypothetical protein